jgi:oligosaccharide repeat unit polymerase
VALVAVGALLAAIAAVLLVAVPDGILQPILITLIAVLSLAPVAVRVVQRRWDPFEPIMIMCVGIFVIFALRPLWMWVSDEWVLLEFDTRQTLTGAALIALVGLVGVLAGYAVSFGRRLANWLPKTPDNWDPRRLTIACMVTVFIGAVLFTFHIGTDGGSVTSYFSGRSANDQTLYGGVQVRTSSAYFALAPYVIVPVALMLLEVARRRRTPLSVALAWGAVLLAMLITVPRGDRTFILAVLMPLIAVPYLHARKRPGMVAVVAAIILSMLFANVLINYRRVENRQQSLPETAFETLSDPTDGINTFMLGIDVSMINILAATYDAVPKRFDYMPGGTITATAALPIPGLLWRTKPQEPGQLLFYELFPSVGTKTRAGFASSMFGGFYTDSGFVGVFAYSFLMGLLLRAIFEFWRRDPFNRSTCMVYAALLPLIVITLRASPTLTSGGLIFLVLPLLAAFWWASRTPARRAMLSGVPDSSPAR